MENDPNLPSFGHTALLKQALEGLRRDERVLAVLLGGSLVIGDADEESDIDLTVVVDDAVVDEFTAGWHDWLERIGPPVLALPGPMPNLITSLMRDGLRLDVTVDGDPRSDRDLVGPPSRSTTRRTSLPASRSSFRASSRRPSH